MSRFRRLATAASLAAILTAASGVAQELVPPRPAQDPKCLPPERLKDDNDRPAARGSDPSLSDQLAQTDGVICPPDVGPDIRLKPPATGDMPVIPPPDTQNRAPQSRE